jgi:hypothetical protein
MWILSWLPDSWMFFIITLVFVIGLVGYALGTLGGVLPFLRPYANTVKLVSIVVMLLGIYLYGGYNTETKWRDRVKELQAEIDKKNIKSEAATKEIVIKYVERVKVIKEKSNANVKEVTKYITQEVDSGCVIPDDFRLLHSRASGNEIPDTSSGANDTGTK